eukprot:COSAG06_NODE_7311_length_2550_cov_1.686659_1_plen_41_part_10
MCTVLLFHTAFIAPRGRREIDRPLRQSDRPWSPMTVNATLR